MGYRRPLRTFDLVFDATSDYAGLEVRVRSLTLAEYFTWYAITGEQQNEMLAERLVGWNVEDDAGAAVPATAEGLLSREPDEVMAIKSAWIDAIVRVRENDPLALSSTNGLQGLLDLPAEPLPAQSS